MPEEGSDPRATGDGDQSIGPTDEKEKKQDQQQGQAKWKWLYSSNLVQYRYNQDSKILAIIFHGNRAYSFRGVDRDTADGLGTAGSAGSYFNRKIKGKFPFSKGDSSGGQDKPRFGGAGATGTWDTPNETPGTSPGAAPGGEPAGGGGHGATGSW